MSHASLSVLCAQHDLFGVHEGSRVLQYASLSSEVAAWEILSPLLAGAVLVLADEEQRASGGPLARLVDEDRIDVVCLPPEMLANWPAGGAIPDGLTVLTPGAACPPEVVDWWSRRCRLLTVHGMTETSGHTTLSEPPPGGVRPPVGRPLAGARLRVLDDALRPVPVGGAGELYVSGAGLALGYLNRPGTTASRFTADPYGPPGARMYRTGELARWHPDGHLEHVTRTCSPSDRPGFGVDGEEGTARLVPRSEQACATSATEQAPSAAAKETLRMAFAEVLGLEQLAADDEFFDLGGDSVTAVQLVSRIRSAGLLVTGGDVFAYRTPAALAAVARQGDGESLSVVGEGGSELPLTPNMHWLRQLGGPMDGFHQAVVVHTPADMTQQLLDSALQAVIDQHDALRLRLTGSAERWSLVVSEPGNVRAAPLLRRTPLADTSATIAEQVNVEANTARRQLAPREGVLLRAVWFDGGPQATGRLLLMLHRLVVDATSWRILLPDLKAAYDALRAGRQPALAPVGTSLRQWAELLVEEARSVQRTAEIPLWYEVLDTPDSPLGSRPLDPTRDRTHTAGSLRLELSPATTHAVLTEVPAIFHTEVVDVLLTGLTLAVADWRNRRGDDDSALLLDLEGHGREEFAEGVDLSRTVGWFTTVCPIRLDVGSLDWDEAWAGGQAVGRLLKSVREQLRSLPDQGLGYGLLRHLAADHSAGLSPAAAPQLAFHYLGQPPATEHEDWAPAPESVRVTAGADAEMPLPHVLELRALAEQRPGGTQLVADWSWAGQVLTETDARAIAETWFRALEILVAHARQPDAGTGRTPTTEQPPAPVQEGLDEFEIWTNKWSR